MGDPANYNLVVSPATRKPSYFTVVHAGIALAFGYLHHFIVITVIFFLIAWLYVIGCDRL
jgi:hypothetical protein